MEGIQSDQILEALEQGELSPEGKFLWGSNYTLLLSVNHKELDFHAVYKPTRGERPLWDFPEASLAGREVAAYWVSEALGWDLVPPTIFRRDGPHGPGSLQLFIEHDPDYNYFQFSEADRRRLYPVAVFDVLINNADRKGSHLLIGPDNHLWLIDHGICFHVDYKLRTVIWDFAGDPLPIHLCEDMTELQEQLTPQNELWARLSEHLTTYELNALHGRAVLLTSSGRFPSPKPNSRPYPWPPV
ncbi:MAG: SCO1664 family protein [Anaerolineales bacterium]|nr:SCO1664 family protein [Anaerolineales bacterium]